MLPIWIWQQPDWPRFRWDGVRLAPKLSQARLAQGRMLGVARFLDTDLTLRGGSRDSDGRRPDHQRYRR